MVENKLKIAIKTYNKIYKIYSQFTFHKLSQYQLNKFISMVPKKAHVLDAGCGSGRDAQYFSEYDLNVIAIDAAKNMVEHAKKNVKGVKFKKMDMRKMNFKNNSFDGIWASASLINNEKKDVNKILGEFMRVLKKGGILYIAVKEGKGREIKREEKYNREPIPFFYYNLDEIQKITEKAGFKILYAGFSNDLMGRKEFRWIELFCRKPIS